MKTLKITENWFYPKGVLAMSVYGGVRAMFLGPEISLESHIQFGSKIFKYECPIFWG